MTKPKKLLPIWKQAWEKSDMSNPLGIAIEKELSKKGYSIYDIRVQLGLIRAKKAEELTRYEGDFLDFWHRTTMIREQLLSDKVSSHPMGQIFLLKTQYGYAETQKIETTGKQNVVLDFGSDE